VRWGPKPPRYRQTEFCPGDDLGSASEISRVLAVEIPSGIPPERVAVPGLALGRGRRQPRPFFCAVEQVSHAVCQSLLSDRLLQHVGSRGIEFRPGGPPAKRTAKISNQRNFLLL
jgi:hypothetical protein